MNVMVFGDDPISIVPPLDVIRTWIQTRMREQVEKQRVLQMHLSTIFPAANTIIVGYVIDVSVESVPDVVQVIDDLYNSLLALEHAESLPWTDAAYYANIQRIVRVRDVLTELDHILRHDGVCACRTTTSTVPCRWYSIHNKSWYRTNALNWHRAE